jgi:hypothetical protein
MQWTLRSTRSVGCRSPSGDMIAVLCVLAFSSMPCCSALFPLVAVATDAQLASFSHHSSSGAHSDSCALVCSLVSRSVDGFNGRSSVLQQGACRFSLLLSCCGVLRSCPQWRLLPSVSLATAVYLFTTATALARSFIIQSPTLTHARSLQMHQACTAGAAPATSAHSLSMTT